MGTLSEERVGALYEYDKSKPILDQILFSHKDRSLLNVRKVFTNDKYFGVTFTSLIHKNGLIIHELRCKDRGASEAIVNDKEKFLKFYNKELASQGHLKLSYLKNKFKSVKAPFLQEHNLEFHYGEDGIYRYSTITRNNSTFRGIYGLESVEKYENYTDLSNFITCMREPTIDEVKEHLIKKADISYANVITEINVSYNNINIYFKE
jgi:hypothetical protein